MNVLVTGVPNVVKDSIVKLAVERAERKARLRVLSFSDFVEEEGQTGELGLLRSTQLKIKENIQLKVLRSPGDVLINGYCTAPTKLGFFPVLSREAVQAFSPGIIIDIEVHPSSLEGKVRDADAYSQHQFVEKSFSAFFAADAGCGIKIIRCGPEGTRPAADELYNTLKDVLGVK